MIIAGHTRYKALVALGMDDVECLVCDGLTDEEVRAMGYRRFPTLQAALDTALRERPEGRVGILPRGGDCLPVVLLYAE